MPLLSKAVSWDLQPATVWLSPPTNEGPSNACGCWLSLVRSPAGRLKARHHQPLPSPTRVGLTLTRTRRPEGQ